MTMYRAEILLLPDHASYICSLYAESDDVRHQPQLLETFTSFDEALAWVRARLDDLGVTKRDIHIMEDVMTSNEMSQSL